MSTPHEFATADPAAVLNQPPPLEAYDLLAGDQPLKEAIVREGADWILPRATELGQLLGQPETLTLARLADRHGPELQTHDRVGQRIDHVEFHPAWHELMRIGVAFQTHSLAWTAGRPGAHVAREALCILRHQIDEGHGCPLTMTFAVIPTLRLQPELAAAWEPRVLSATYDPRSLPVERKHGALFGMAMTERQGGSDVRANSTRAVRVDDGQAYRLTGHKWFCSAPMCDAFLVLAQAPGGLTCFLMPRFTPDGARNAVRVMRLKDKLGNRSNASSEVELEGAWAQRVGEEGRGVRTIIEMVHHTRLDCTAGSAATLRRAVAEALHHAAHRKAFGRRLIEQPLMTNVLADLCLESEASTALALRVARSFDEAPGDEAARLFSRLATPVAKYWVTRRAMAVVAEAMECHGGGGYVEDGPMPRLYRDVPVNAIWEGSGNVQCLDVLRAIGREPACLEALRAELAAARGRDDRYDAFCDETERELTSDPTTVEPRARRVVGRLARALQASILLQHGPPAVADAFCAARLAALGPTFGELPTGVDTDTLISRSMP